MVTLFGALETLAIQLDRLITLQEDLETRDDKDSQKLAEYIADLDPIDLSTPTYATLHLRSFEEPEAANKAWPISWAMVRLSTLSRSFSIPLAPT